MFCMINNGVFTSDKLTGFSILDSTIKKTYPRPSDEENKRLVNDYKQYDEDCAEKIRLQNELILRNFGLIRSIARPYLKISTTHTLEDLLNYGVIGFISGLKKYELSYEDVKPMTYIADWIRSEISNSLRRNDKIIRRHGDFEFKMNHFKRLLEQYAMSGLPVPTDEVIAERLDVSLETVKLMWEDYKFDATSLNAKINAENETALDYFLGTEEMGYECVINEIAEEEVLMFLKNRLPANEYYILYHHTLSVEQRSFQKIANEIGVTKQTVEARFKKTIGQIAPFFTDRRILTRSIGLLKSQYHFNRINIYPVDIDGVVLFFFVRDALSLEEQELYKLVLFRMEDYTDEFYASYLGVDLEELHAIYADLKSKIKNYDKVKYAEFKAAFIAENKSKLFALEKDIKISLKNKKM